MSAPDPGAAARASGRKFCSTFEDWSQSTAGRTRDPAGTFSSVRHPSGVPPEYGNAAAQVSPWCGGRSEQEAGQLQEQRYAEAGCEATPSRLPSPIRLARGELDHRAAIPSTEHVRYWREHGLDDASVAGFAGLLAVVPIRLFEPNRFDFGVDGDPLGAVVEAFDEDGETVIDLVAWPLNEPDRVLSMFGRAPVLGLSAALNPATYAFGRPLNVHRTPLDWVKSGCDGCAVVVRHLAAPVLLEAHRLGRISGQDRQHRNELFKLARSIVDPSRFVAPKRRAS